MDRLTHCPTGRCQTVTVSFHYLTHLSLIITGQAFTRNGTHFIATASSDDSDGVHIKIWKRALSARPAVEQKRPSSAPEPVVANGGLMPKGLTLAFYFVMTTLVLGYVQQTGVRLEIPCARIRLSSPTGFYFDSFPIVSCHESYAAISSCIHKIWVSEDLSRSQHSASAQKLPPAQPRRRLRYPLRRSGNNEALSSVLP